jgi:hypothetical protein
VRSRYAIGGIIAAALLALLVGAAAASGGQVAGLTAQQCSQERAAIGKKAFRKRYGARRTMRSCVKRTRPQVVVAMGTAASACQDELDEGGTADFIDTYGDDATDSIDYAMSECVAEAVDEILNREDHLDDGSDEGSD